MRKRAILCIIGLLSAGFIVCGSLLTYRFIAARTLPPINRFVKIAIKEPVANNNSIRFGPVVLTLPWETDNWKSFFDYGFNFHVQKIGCLIVCINAYPNLDVPEYRALIDQLFNLEAPFPGGERLRRSLLSNVCGDSTVYLFETSTQKGFFVERKNRGGYTITIFSKTASNSLSISIVFKEKIEPSRRIELARTLASCVRFDTGQNYLTPEQFKNVVLGMNRTKATAE